MVICKARGAMRTRRYVCDTQRRRWPSAGPPVGLRLFCPLAALLRSGYTYGYTHSLAPCQEPKQPAAKCKVISAWALSSGRYKFQQRLKSDRALARRVARVEATINEAK